MRHFFYIQLLFFCFYINSSFAQSALINELEQKIKSEKDDSTLSLFYSQLSVEYNYYDSAKAYNCFSKALTLATNASFNYGIGEAYVAAGKLYIVMSNLTEATAHYKKAIFYYGKENSERVTKALNGIKMNLALISFKQGLFNESIRENLEVLPYFEKIKDIKKQAVINNNIASAYTGLSYFSASLEFQKRSAILRSILGDSAELAKIYYNIATSYLNMQLPDSCIFYLKRAGVYITPSTDMFVMSHYYSTYGNYYYKAKKYEEAINAYNKAFTYASTIKDKQAISAIFQNMGKVYEEMGQYKKAKEQYIRSLELSNSLKNLRIVKYSFDRLAGIEKKMGNKDAAISYLLKSAIANENITSMETATKINFIETEYEYKKKEDNLLALQKETQIQSLKIKQKNIINYLLTGASLFLLAFIILGIWAMTNQKKITQQNSQIQNQRIADLEKEKLLAASDFALKGQENERIRIARDLHDGLGGRLSGLKMYVSTYCNPLQEKENLGTFLKTTVIRIDETIDEMREISNNLMPQSLLKFGLVEALKDYIETIKATSSLDIHFQVYRFEVEDKSKQISIYRIIQELINNIIKHAKATEVIIQLDKEEQLASVCVEDNGIGFNIRMADKINSNGLKNIQARVDYLKGNLEIKSVAGQGTSVYFDFTC